MKYDSCCSGSVVGSGLVAWWIGLTLAAQSVLGQTIPNPSFELDTFTVYPGYIRDNGPITGWNGSPPSQVGLNPAGGQSPFANNGAIPHGAKVAFIQSQAGSPATLSTVISDLVPGQRYTVNFRLNARTNAPAQTPFLKVGIDGRPMVNISTIGVQIGGTTTPYRYAAFDFVAEGSTATLWLTNDAPGDTTVLVDDFRINVSTNGWSYAAWTGDADAGVDSTRNVTHAYNFGGGAAPDTTIHGVLFKGVVGANPAIANEFSMTGVGSAYGSDDPNNITTGGSAALARRFIYGGNPGYFFIAGLVPGMDYVAVFYSVAWEEGMRAQTFSYYDDRLTVNQDHFGNNNGIRIMYRYVAPPSGAITLMVSPTLPGNTFHLYGFANYEANPRPLPIIGLQPRSQVTTPGSTVTFSVTAGGARPLQFQWLKEGDPIPGGTNRFLTLSNVIPELLGQYAVVVSNPHGAVTSQVATLTFGPIANPGFEADVFRTWPGYVSGNTPISGWTASRPGRAGVNPLPDFPGPFANNGAVPEGSQVGFIQSIETNWISTRLYGLTPGQKYTLSFRANARSDQRPLTRVAIDGQWVGEFRAGPMGGTEPYRAIAFDFTPATDSPVLYLTNDATGDHTILLDDFRVAPSVTGWSYAPWTADSSSGVDPSRGYSHAYNFGSPGLAVDTTLNGVRFLGVPGANPAVPGQFAATGFTGVFGADDNNVFAAGGGGAALARSFLYYAGTIPANVAQTLTLSNLVPGVEYEVTIFGVGFDAKYYARAATFEVGQDRMTISENVYDNKNGIRVSYRYVADASGTITLRWWPTERTSSFHTYGFCNAEVASTHPPIVYRQPQGRTVAGGATVVLDCLVGGRRPLLVQWYKDGLALPDQTNLVLTLTGVDGSATGDYTVVVSNALGMVTSAVARVEVGLAMVNPSFELDTFPTYPGYISGNTPITGWTVTIPTGAGINPAGGQSPFANNGQIPDGTQVAFIQADGCVLSQMLSGMGVGRTYYLVFYENSRADYPAPSLTVRLGGQTLVPTHVVPSGAYVRVVSVPFLATTDSAELAFIKTAGPAGGDSTVLIDSVAVVELPPSAPVFVTQPQGVFVKEGEDVSLSAVALGTLPMSYQWQRNGEDVPGAWANTLALPGILLSQAGAYTLIAENALGRATSAVAVVKVGLGLAELFNTGVDDYGVVLPGALVDPHYQLISSADPAFPGPNAMTHLNQWPVGGTAYMPNGPRSGWIGPRVNETGYGGNLDGVYVYRTSFLLDTLDPTTAEIRGQWAVDNFGLDIRLNGVSLGLVNNAGFTTFTPFTITSGFIAGSNTLDFVVSNAPPPGPTALRVELYGLAVPLPPTAPSIVSQPQSQLVQEGGEAVLTVLVTASPPVVYQWYFEGLDLLGQTNRILRLSRVSQWEHQGYYWVEVTNPEGWVTSQPVFLAVNRAPAAAPDRVATAPGQSLVLPRWKLLLNDSDPDGDALELVAVSPVSTSGGSVVLEAHAVRYNPPAGYTGTDTFSYSVVDARGGRGVGTVTVSVGETHFIRVVTLPQVLPGQPVRISYQGIPGYPYVVEWAPEVTGPWTPLRSVVAGPDGAFEIEDPTEPRPPMRFYRVIYP